MADAFKWAEGDEAARASFREAVTEQMQFNIDAVIRNFEIIDETAGHIPLEIQEKYPELAWLEMRGMRNIIAHEYFGIGLKIIWRTVQRDLTPLADGLREMLKKES